VNREQLAHILRAASTIVDDPNILVIGSQSVLATFDEDELPDAATASMEVDLAYFDDPAEDKADAVDGAIGELSPFHEMNGCTHKGSACGPRCCRRVGVVVWSPGRTSPLAALGLRFWSRTTASCPNSWCIGRRTSRSRQPCSNPA
jgi:hypothetical protein